MEIEYENGVPKGYLERRKRAGLFYIYSVYLYCLLNLMVKYEIIKFSDHRMQLIVFCLEILLSITLLCHSVMAVHNFKGIMMHNHSEFKAFSRLEKLLYPLPVLVTSIFIPLDIITYLCVAIPSFFAVSWILDANSKNDNYNRHVAK